MTWTTTHTLSTAAGELTARCSLSFDASAATRNAGRFLMEFTLAVARVLRAAISSTKTKRTSRPSSRTR